MMKLPCLCVCIIFHILCWELDRENQLLGQTTKKRISIEHAVEQMPAGIETVLWVRTNSKSVTNVLEKTKQVNLVSFGLAMCLPDQYLGSADENWQRLSKKTEFMIIGSKNHRPPRDTPWGMMGFDGVGQVAFQQDAKETLDELFVELKATSVTGKSRLGNLEFIELSNGKSTRYVARVANSMVWSTSPELLTKFMAIRDEGAPMNKRYFQNPKLWRHVRKDSICGSVRTFLPTGNQGDPTSPTNTGGRIFVPRDLDAIGEVYNLAETNVAGQLQIELVYVSRSDSKKEMAEQRWNHIHRTFEEFELKKEDKNTVIGVGKLKSSSLIEKETLSSEAALQLLLLIGHAVYL